MFTGIIESMGFLKSITHNGSNKTFSLQSALAHGFKVDQSVAHDGVCLTIESISGDTYTVTAVEETLNKTALHQWQQGAQVNLEQSLRLNGRLDGHFVQGHVDTTAICESIVDKQGSHEITFSFPHAFAALIIEKGSVCVNGVSLTAFNVSGERFTVAVIPYTWSHTNLQYLSIGDAVNIEFDMLGKYFVRFKENHNFI